MALCYCWPQSVLPGDAVALQRSDSGRVKVVRDGARPEVVLRGPSDTTTIAVGADWRSGLYIVRVGDDPPTAWFVVRAPESLRARCLLVLATNTWNAYNDTEGLNYYTGADTLSFKRPLAVGMLEKPPAHGARLVDGARAYDEYTREHGLDFWHGMAGWAGQERRFVCWAEERDIALDLATNLDLERGPSLLDGYDLVISVGHDEYWTWAMRDAVDAFVARGGNVAFLSGNACYWQVRVEEADMVCYKHRFEEDPLYGSDDAHLTTTMWADPILGRPEASMTGVSFTRGGYHRIARSVRHGSGGFEVHQPDHWLFAGTGLRRGDLLGAELGAVGYECDGCDLAMRDGVPVATGTGGTPIGFEVLATAPATPFDADTTPLPLAPGGDFELEFHARRLLGSASSENCDRLRNGHAVLGCYERGGTVVTVGTTEWAHALGDPRVDRVTRNIIDHALSPQR